MFIQTKNWRLHSEILLKPKDKKVYCNIYQHYNWLELIFM